MFACSLPQPMYSDSSLRNLTGRFDSFLGYQLHYRREKMSDKSSNPKYTDVPLKEQVRDFDDTLSAYDVLKKEFFDKQ